MADIIIKGVQPYDGRYDLDRSFEFTTREWGWVKRLSGYLPATLFTDDEDESVFSDPELTSVLAVIMMRRAGRIETREVPAVFDKLIDAPFGASIVIEVSEAERAAELEEGDADGPPPRSSNENEPSSGDNGRTSSETSPPTPPASGIPDLGSSASPRVTPLAT